MAMNFVKMLVGGSKLGTNQVEAPPTAAGAEPQTVRPGLERANGESSPCGELPAGDKRERLLAKKRRYQERIEHLRREARQDGYDLDPDSGRDFWNFVDSNPFFRNGGVVLCDNGNLYAIWDDEDGDQVGLHFMGSGKMNYVLISRSASAGEKRHGCGHGDFDVVKQKIGAYDLWSLVGE